jgi:hypothetical protein
MMNEKQLAHRLREIYTGKRPDSEINEIADELDPPNPKPGTPIVWRWRHLHEWRHGIIEDGGWTRTSDGLPLQLDQVQWEPARMLGPRQVPVDVPPVEEWRYSAITMTLKWVDYTGLYDVVHEITRAEAKQMEAG